MGAEEIIPWLSLIQAGIGRTISPLLLTML
jgi:hypothetical protein